MNEVSAALIWLVTGLMPLDGTGPSSAPMAYHVFGGRPARVDCAIQAPAGGTVDVEADLFQQGGGLAAPLEQKIAVARGVKPQPDRPLVSWTLPIPAVKRETQMVARLRVRPPGGEWTPAGGFKLTVYPPGFAGENLAAVAKERRLRVFGPGTLREFLRGQGIEFEDLGPDLSAVEPDPECVDLGQAPAERLGEWLEGHTGWRGTLVVYCPDAPLLPGVYVTAGRGSRLAKLVFPENLAEPRAQKTLLETLKTVITPNTP